MLLVNLLMIGWLVLCLLAANANPTEVQYIAIFTLTTPIAVIVNIGFALFWLFSRTHKWYSILSLLALIAGFNVISMIFAFNLFDKNDMAQKPGTFKLMTWNIHGLGIFNIPIDKDYDREILHLIKEENADILCLPEFSLPKSSIMAPYAETILNNNEYKDYRFQIDNSLGKSVFLGTAVFSKFPMQNFAATPLSDYIFLLQADVLIRPEDTMRMFFVHLNTFGLSDYDKAYIERIGKNSTIKKDLHKSKTFIGKFNSAFYRRALEVDSAKRIIDKSPYPVLICGDFNDLPASYTYTTLRDDLADAFLERGTGLGRTYNHIAPTLRIDHIFYDDSTLRCIGYKSEYTSLSDHNPVIANFEILSAQ